MSVTSVQEKPAGVVNQFSRFAEGLDHPEGVAWGLDGYIYAGGEAGQIYRVSLNGTYEEIGTTGGFILGVALDGNGNVYACDSGNQDVRRVTPEGKVTIYSKGADGRKMVNPNYDVFDEEGNLYVSDSAEYRENNGCIFRIRPDGVTDVVSDELSEFPNGIALAPDGSELHVVLSTLPGVAKAQIDKDGGLGTPEVVVRLPQTVPDGLAFDREGSLYISCYTPCRIFRLSPDGELSIFAEDWEALTLASPTNMAFCGSNRTTLVVANLARWHLSKGDMDIPGVALHYPRI